MEQIHFVIYRLKSIIIYLLLLIYLLTHFLLFIFIQRYNSLNHQIMLKSDEKQSHSPNGWNSLNHQMMLKSDEKQSHSPNIGNFVQYSLKKWLTQGLWECLFFFIIFIFIYLIIWWGIGIAFESKLEDLKDDTFCSHNCSCYFLLLCLILLFYYYSNILYMRVELQFMGICG
jgi:hypothetical protein